MKLTLALDMIAPSGKAAKAGMPAEAQDSAVSEQFASLLAGEIPLPAELEALPEAVLAPQPAAMPGNGLPHETGKSLPVAGEAAEALAIRGTPAIPAAPVVAEHPVPQAKPAQAAQVSPAQEEPDVADKPAKPDQQIAKPEAPAPAPQRQPLAITVTAQQTAPAAQAVAPVLPAEVAERQQAAQQSLSNTQPLAKPRGEVTLEPDTGDTGDAATGERQQGQPRMAASAPAAAPVPAPSQPVTISAEQQQVTTTTPADRAFAASPTTSDRHDFNAVVERLAHARETAQPGRADMSIVHREFGNISVQFEMAGHALKVAMTSSDAAFAPAVQAALADRPIAAVSDAARADMQTGRNDGQSSSQNTAGQQGQPSPDGQRHDANSRSAQLRQQSGHPAIPGRADGEGAPARTSARNPREHGLFA